MATYQNAIDWIAYNDDTEFLEDDTPSLSVTACLVADIFNKSHETILADLKRAIKRRDRDFKERK